MCKVCHKIPNLHVVPGVVCFVLLISLIYLPSAMPFLYVWIVYTMFLITTKSFRVHGPQSDKVFYLTSPHKDLQTYLGWYYYGGRIVTIRLYKQCNIYKLEER